MTQDLKGDAARNLERARNWKLDLHPLDDFRAGSFDWYVDSLFGMDSAARLIYPR